MSRSVTENGRGRRASVFGCALLGLAICAGTSLAGEEAKNEYRLNPSWFSRLGRDFRELVRSPSNWDGGDVLTLAAVSGTGLLIFAFDEDIQRWAQDRRSSASDRTAARFSVVGDGAFLVGITAALYAAGELGESIALRKMALLSLESLAAASLLSWSLKALLGRARPSTGESSRSFHPIAFKNRHWSLPSGHAVAAFSVATVIAEQTEGFLVDALVYGLAAAASASRVHQNKHWASDVFFGSALGYFVAKKICGLNKKENATGIRFGLDCSAGRQALSLRIAF